MVSLVPVIDFDVAAHRYTVRDTGEVLTSVTQNLEKIIPKFDTDFQAIKYAAKHGFTPDYWKAEWKRINKVSIDRGNGIHNELEDSISTDGATDKGDGNFSRRDILNCLNGNVTSKTDLKDTIIMKKYPQIYEDLVYELEKGYKIYSERLVYHLGLKACGTIDVPLIKDNKLLKIKDWKTNKDDIKFTSGYYKKVNGIRTNIWVDKDERLLTPVKHLQKCKGTIQGLQLNMYGFLAKQIGLIPVEYHIWHIHPDYCKRYDVADYQKEVEDILKYNLAVSQRKPVPNSLKLKKGLFSFDDDVEFELK